MKTFKQSIFEKQSKESKYYLNIFPQFYVLFPLQRYSNSEMTKNKQSEVANWINEHSCAKMTAKHRQQCDILIWSHLRDYSRRSGAPSLAGLDLPLPTTSLTIKIDIAAFKFQIILSQTPQSTPNSTPLLTLQERYSFNSYTNFSVSSQEKIVGESTLVGYHYWLERACSLYVFDAMAST